jgi:hypothetical protein
MNTNPPNRSKPRRSQRNPARSREHQQILALKQELKSEAVMLRPVTDPPSYKATSIFSRTVRFIGSSAGFNLTPNSVLTVLFGTSLSNYQIQFMSLNVWGLTTAESSDIPLIVTVTNDVSSLDNTEFTDRGVFGSSRPNVHLRYAHEVRDHWFASSATTIVTSISQIVPTPVTTGLIADVHVRLLLTPSSVTY